MGTRRSEVPVYAVAYLSRLQFAVWGASNRRFGLLVGSRWSELGCARRLSRFGVVDTLRREVPVSAAADLPPEIMDTLRREVPVYAEAYLSR